MSVTKAIAASSKTPAIIGTGTAGTGVAVDGTGVINFIEWIPNDIGKLAVLAGLALTMVSLPLAVINTRIKLIELRRLQDE